MSKEILRFPGLTPSGTDPFTNVPKVTAISWEKGRRKPTGAALRLLDLLRKNPNLLQEF